MSKKRARRAGKKAGKAGKKAGKKAAKEGGKKGGRPKLSAAQKRTNIAKRAQLLKSATMLADFHGGRSPVLSGCGRPRGS